MIPSTPIQQPLLTIDAVAGTAGSLLPTSIIHRTEAVAGSVGNQNFMITTDGGRFLLKAGHPDNLATEAWACDRVRAAGVSAPAVVATDLAGASLGVAMILLRCVPGSPSPAGAAVYEAGRQLRSIHAIGVQGFGHLDPPVNGAAPVGAYDSWESFTDTTFGFVDQLLDHDLLHRSLADRVRSCLHQHRDAVGQDGPPALLHGDLQTRHLFAANGRLSGFIDFGDVAGGDPIFDLARYSQGGAATLPDLLAGYGLELTEDLTRRFTVYRLLQATWALYYEWRLGGDWFDAYRQRMAAESARLVC